MFYLSIDYTSLTGKTYFMKFMRIVAIALFGTMCSTVIDTSYPESRKPRNKHVISNSVFRTYTDDLALDEYTLHY